MKISKALPLLFAVILISVTSVASDGLQPSQYWQYSAAAEILGEFLVNDDTLNSDQDFPAVAMDSAGNFVIAWEDLRNGNRDIYAQRYSPSGAVISNFQVNADGGSATQAVPAVFIDRNQNFVIAWQDNRSGSSYDIYAQRYDSSGAALDTNFKVNDDVGSSGQFQPDIAGEPAGSFVITWIDPRLGSYDIFVQRYSSTGAALDTNFKANTDAGSAVQALPAISSDVNGNFVIAWYDTRNGDADIYAQRFNSSGAALDTNVRVNTDSGSAAQSVPDASFDENGTLIIVWHDERNGNPDIYAQRYDSSGTAIDTNFKVDTDAGSAAQTGPVVSCDAAGNQVVAWQDFRSGNNDIYAQRYGPFGAAVDTNFRVNADSGTAEQTVPAIAGDAIGNSVAAWRDFRSGNFDIFALWLESSCSAIPGDANASGSLTLGDVIATVNFVFNKPGFPACASNDKFCWLSELLCRGDWNGSMTVTLADVIQGVNKLFAKPGGPWDALPSGLCCQPAL